MAQAYRARDTRLDRVVAIEVAEDIMFCDYRAPTGS